MYNNCAETHLGGGVLSAFAFPWIAIACRSQLWHHIRMRVMATTMMRPKASAIACVNERVAKLFSAWKLQIQLVTGLYMSPVSYWWPTASCCSSRESCELLKQHCFDKTCDSLSLYWASSMQLSIYLVKRLSWVSCKLLCINWNKPLYC